ncbi:myosin-G heavy chain-like isoform X1 [Photinus pyralis]|uniref:myosin-G heavy chain-like isoform X1 n=1 Tax=Photinus pyralis TaxID=7054 RepID=UPI0012670080|nr:myosin-G heavy chain-like isoform X1 [Photinus pyralis]
MISSLKKRLGELSLENNNMSRSGAEDVAVNNNNNETNLNKFTKEKSLLCMPLNVVELNRILSGNSQDENRFVSSSLSTDNKRLITPVIRNENANSTKLCKNAETRESKIEQKSLINRVSVSEATASKRPLKSRNSFHQDVNEALNSLLWQPYEYQNKQVSDESCSVSSYSSCCSLSSLDLERRPNNGLIQSPRSGNKADLHLTIEMVNNLTCYGNQLSQCKEGKGTRDWLATSSPTKLLTNVSACEQAAEKVSVKSYRSNCNEFASSSETMRVEISNSLTDPSTSAFNPPDGRSAMSSVVNVNQNVTGSSDSISKSTGGAIRLLPNHGYQRSISSDMIPSNLNSIVSANVVGLPNHPRHASVPSSTTQNRNSTGSGFIFPNHPRNASEPSAMIQQPVVINHSRNGSTPSTFMPNNPARNAAPATNSRSHVTVNQNSNISCANIVSILSHHRHSSHVNSAELPTLGGNILRAASVPKPDSTNLTIAQTRIPSNVSAVDVNFYRAVPVTVVSNVPSIQCVNNTSEIGNNISNVNIVQAMPPTTLSLTPPRILPSRPHSGVTGTTQVTVHNSQTDDPPQRVAEETRTRTFTSTEAQTDDANSALVRTTATDRALTREQRRRERRERRHLRRANNSNHPHRAANWNSVNGDRLPDLLNNHMPPPYSPNNANNAPVATSGLVHNSIIPGSIVPNNVVPSAVVASHVVPFHSPVGQVPLVQGGGPVAVPVPAPSGFRFPFPTAGFRR